MAENDTLNTKPVSKVDTDPQVDISSVLDRIKSLEKEKLNMTSELQQNNAKLEKFTAAKRIEMQNTLDSVIQKWLHSIATKDTGVKVVFLSLLDC